MPVIVIILNMAFGQVPMPLWILQEQYLLKSGLGQVIQRFAFLKNLLHYLKSLYSYRIVLRTFYHFYESEKNFNMKKQRICIVGDGLSGLMTALALNTVSYTHLRAHETEADLVCRLLLEKK